MTISLLVKPQTVTLDANGNGTVTLRPDVGQNWAPIIIGVATQQKQTPVPHATVYHGAPGVAPQNMQYIDDTFLGSGDTSSVISGTTIQYGEAIVVTFERGNPGDVASVTVYGQTSDLPSNIQLPPQIPGTRFVGHPTTEVLVQDAFVSANLPIVVPPGGTVKITSGASGVGVDPVDVRQFASYYIKIHAAVVGGVATAANPSFLSMRWYSAIPTTIGGFTTYTDTYEWWSDSAGGAFACFSGLFFAQDVHHGAYFEAFYTNRSATDSMEVFYLTEYTTRSLLSAKVAQEGTSGSTDGNDAVLAISTGNINAGAHVRFFCPIAYGRASWKLENTGPGAVLAYNINYGSYPIIEQIILASGASDRREIILPKHALYLDLFNGGANTGYKLNVISDWTKS